MGGGFIIYKMFKGRGGGPTKPGTNANKPNQSGGSGFMGGGGGFGDIFNKGKANV